ncbi:hypothetical protein UA08_09205 [Talaromyces atroroseus]|uniref:ZN622/Rei1/Reh1 zinc finger C2H2-type domain-containing protein n=1 Tax=Talaromyces atroroseus TaxID=1441469 RepID=A0A1Q5Q6P0_TALAT|nr:hypothetical protein UA08_09205 [Talaromyces atroroseus]OKL55517.1 hypothetical protein UA08_09205 [Talaromyces atroroseus]
MPPITPSNCGVPEDANSPKRVVVQVSVQAPKRLDTTDCPNAKPMRIGQVLQSHARNSKKARTYKTEMLAVTHNESNIIHDESSLSDESNHSYAATDLTNESIIDFENQLDIHVLYRVNRLSSRGYPTIHTRAMLIMFQSLTKLCRQRLTYAKITRYLHLVIFGYRECIQCGTERATIQAVQQHMIGKGHCKFDVSEEDSEFAEFYDFVGLEDDTEGEMEDDGDTRNYEEADISSTRKPLLAGEESIHLPSGKIITKKSSAQSERSFTQLHRRIRNRASQLEYSLMEPDDVEGSDTETLNSDKVKTRTLSKREKREKAMAHRKDAERR